MLNPEQIRARQRDKEIRLLKEENEKLQTRLAELKPLLIALFKEIAKGASFSAAVTIRKQIAELESDV